MCGEKIPRKAYHSDKRGSPPRVRGEDCAVSDFTVVERITPACAGRSLCNSAAVRLVEDHPRVCGEKARLLRDVFRYIGSPPACAGRSDLLLDYEVLDGDHPRVCGEKCSHSLKPASHAGSPPRVRGEVLNPYYVSMGIRITPACAGRSDKGCNRERR